MKTEMPLIVSLLGFTYSATLFLCYTCPLVVGDKRMPDYACYLISMIPTALLAFAIYKTP